MGRIEWTVTSGNILFLVALEQSQQKEVIIKRKADTNDLEKRKK